jgi:hypothetical protein
LVDVLSLTAILLHEWVFFLHKPFTCTELQEKVGRWITSD